MLRRWVTLQPETSSRSDCSQTKAQKLGFQNGTADAMATPERRKRTRRFGGKLAEGGEDCALNLTSSGMCWPIFAADREKGVKRWQNPAQESRSSTLAARLNIEFGTQGSGWMETALVHAMLSVSGERGLRNLRAWMTGLGQKGEANNLISCLLLMRDPYILDRSIFGPRHMKLPIAPPV